MPRSRCERRGRAQLSKLLVGATAAATASGRSASPLDNSGPPGSRGDGPDIGKVYPETERPRDRLGQVASPKRATVATDATADTVTACATGKASPPGILGPPAGRGDGPDTSNVYPETARPRGRQGQVASPKRATGATSSDSDSDTATDSDSDSDSDTDADTDTDTGADSDTGADVTAGYVRAVTEALNAMDARAWPKLAGFEVHRSLDSTMDRAAHALKTGKAEGYLVVADHQTQGRGQHGRQWSSPPNSDLYFSFILRDLAPQQAPSVALVLGAAIYHVIESLGIEAKIKWPNDVLATGKKLAGILVEAHTRTVTDAVVGIGLNVAREVFETQIEGTSLKLQTQKQTAAIGKDDRARILCTLIGACQDHVARWKEGIFDLAQLNPHLAYFDQNVSITGGQTPITGKVRGIAQDGALLLKTETGIERIYAGSIKTGTNSRSS